MNLDSYGDGAIDQEDIQVINYLRGNDTTLCPDCDLDDDGAITGLDARKVVVQGTRSGCVVE